MERYILRSAHGDRSPILSGSGHPVSEFFTSSGTSGGEPKLIPTVEDERHRHHRQRSLVMAVINQYVPGLDQGSSLYFHFVKSETTTPGGLPARTILTSTYKSDHFKNVPYDCQQPKGIDGNSLANAQFSDELFRSPSPSQDQRGPVHQFLLLLQDRCGAQGSVLSPLIYYSLRLTLNMGLALVTSPVRATVLVIVAFGPGALPWSIGSLGLAQVRDRDIPPSLRSGVSPRWRQWKLLPERRFILPGGKRRIEAGPLDEDLGNRSIMALVQAALEDGFRNLELVVDVGQRGTWERRRTWSTKPA
ncbi:uncharacterized protein [Miscanthus floridulus]|uniref:uncharacterized protein n=1 Tax=Miscanthus floridulus TaxID=154761 RepID=UPI0034599AA5